MEIKNANFALLCGALELAKVDLKKEDYNAMVEIFTIADTSAPMELDITTDGFQLSFTLAESVDETELNKFVQFEEQNGYSVAVATTTHDIIVTKGNVMPANTTAQTTSNPAAAPAADPMQAAMAQFAAAMQAANDITAKLQQQIAASEAAQKVFMADLKKSTDEAVAAAKAEAENSAKAATAASERCAQMADAINAARQAQHQAEPESGGDSWYTSTTAKVVGGVTLAGAIGVAGYFAWDHFNKV